jgi:hypothetical protein
VAKLRADIEEPLGFVPRGRDFNDENLVNE